MYSFSRYLTMLRMAKRSENTIKGYGKVLRSYAKFLNVSPDEIHNHLTPENLVAYANSRAGNSERGIRMHLSILHRYFMINGVKFDPLELNILKAQRIDESDDKPLTLETLQKMMNLGSLHTKTILITLISTGMRAGECCQILLSDVKGDIIHIRPEIAKGRRGGDVYLTKEARDFMDLWLKDRDRYIKTADKRGKYLVRKGYGKAREKNDKRLFACSYATLLSTFSHLYDQVDGEQGKYHAKITPHSTRKYFRTQAVKTMPLDLVEKIMRHSGYLTDEYVRIPPEEARRQFHAGESALYILRSPEVNDLKRERDELKEAMQTEMETMKQEHELMKIHIKELMGKG